MVRLHAASGPLPERRTDEQATGWGSRGLPVPPRGSAHLLAAVALLLLCGLAATGTLLALRLLPALFVPWPAERGEGLIVAASLRLLDGQSLYPPYTQRFNGLDFPYPPLYAICLAGLTSTGLPPFVAGRLLSVVGLALIAAAVGYLIFRATGKRLAALVAVGSLSLFGEALPLWAGLARVDTLAVGLALTGLALACRPSKRPELLAAPFFVLSLYTKETMFAAPAAVLLVLVSERQLKRAAVFGALVAAPVAAGFWLLNGWSHDAYATDLLILGKARGMSAGWLAALIATIVLQCGPLLALGSLGLWWGRADTRVRLYAAVAVASFLLTAGKPGSGPYYAMEMAAAAAVGLGIVAARLLDAWRCGPIGPAWSARRLGVALALVALGAAAPVLLLIGAVPSALSPSLRLEGMPSARAVALLRSTPGPVFSDLAGELVLAGRTAEVSDTFATTQLARAGLWDDGPLVSDLRQRRFALVLLDVDPRDASVDALGEAYHGRLTPAVAAAIRSAYHLSATIAPTGPGGSTYYAFTPGGEAP